MRFRKGSIQINRYNYRLHTYVQYTQHIIVLNFRRWAKTLSIFLPHRTQQKTNIVIPMKHVSLNHNNNITFISRYKFNYFIFILTYELRVTIRDYNIPLHLQVSTQLYNSHNATCRHIIQVCIIILQIILAAAYHGIPSYTPIGYIIL